MGGLYMDIRVLRYFLAVTRENTINAAASSLHISQPTLSRQLIDLEAELGSKLFLRGSRKLVLTEAGIFLRKKAQEIVDLFEKTEYEFHIPEELTTGEILIGGDETETIRRIVSIVKQFRVDYPYVRYNLFRGNENDVIDRLDKGLLDFGILVEPVNISKYYFLNMQAKDLWGILMRKDSPLSEKEYITDSDLISIPLLTSKATMGKSAFSKWIGTHINELDVVATYDLVYNASIMVEEGIGYAICRNKLVNITSDSQLCFKPLYPKLESKLAIAWKRDQVFSHAAEKFLERLRAQFGPVRG